MKTSLACVRIFIQFVVAYAEVIFIRRTESHSLELSCSPELTHGTLTGLHLYHSSTQSQITLLSMSEGSKLRVNLQHQGRLQVSGGLDSLRVNVTISHLQYTDTGLYIWDLTYRTENRTNQIISGSHQVFLLVEGTGRPCQCSHRYLLYTIFTAVGLLLLTLYGLGIDKCVRGRHRHKLQPPAPIYEEMNRKQQQGPGNPRNNHEDPSHLEEANFPVYANPTIRQTQDNYYACPRSLM